MSDNAAGPAVLPRIHGRAPRVALLVYNHAHNDSRVLKTAASLRAGGAQVRIFAVARRRSGHPEGDALVGEELPVHRAPEFELVRYAAGRLALRVARRLTGRVSTADLLGRPGDVPRPSAEAAHPAAGVTGPTVGADPPALPASGRRAVQDLWLRTYRTLSLGLYWLHTARAVASWQPDVIHANDGNTLAPAMWSARRSGGAIVYDSHELWLHRNVRPHRPVAPWVERAVEAAGIRRATRVITVSPSIATWLQQHYDLSRTPSLVRNAPRSKPSEGRGGPTGRGRLRDLAGLSSTDRVITYAGRITTSRGLEETIGALALLPAKVHLVLLGYGEPDYLARLHALVAAMDLAHRVHFVAAVASDEVSEALADADVSVVFVRPICLSYRFSLPNKLFESIHAGVPVVAAELPDTAAVVREHGVGEVFATEDPVEIARTIDAVLADSRAYRTAARRASSVLTWEHEEVTLLRVYADVLASHVGAARRGRRQGSAR